MAFPWSYMYIHITICIRQRNFDVAGYDRVNTKPLVTQHGNESDYRVFFDIAVGCFLCIRYIKAVESHISKLRPEAETKWPPFPIAFPWMKAIAVSIKFHEICFSGCSGQLGNKPLSEAMMLCFTDAYSIQFFNLKYPLLLPVYINTGQQYTLDNSKCNLWNSTQCCNTPFYFFTGSVT